MTAEPSCEISVRVIPKSSKNKMELQADGTLRIWVNAPPVDGEANDAVRRLVAKSLGIAQSRVVILRGEHGRSKQVQITGFNLEKALETMFRGKN